MHVRHNYIETGKMNSAFTSLMVGLSELIEILQFIILSQEKDWKTLFIPRITSYNNNSALCTF